MCASVLGAPCVAAQADPRPRYAPPGGFNGLEWGQPLTALGPARLARVNVVMDSKGAATASNQDPHIRGSFTVAEYYRDPDSNPWAPSLVALQTATYMFCDEWLGSSVPVDAKQHLQFCGTRIFYRSETGAQLAALSAVPETNQDRVLRHLIRQFGPPDGHRLRRGEISAGPMIEGDTADAPSTTVPGQASRTQASQGVLRYRWCGVRESTEELLPDCAATITLLFNHDTGWGMVIFATDTMYKFAHARHATHDENNELYMALVSSEPDRPTKRRTNDCMRTTGSLVCGGRLSTLSERDLRLFEP